MLQCVMLLGGCWVDAWLGGSSAARVRALHVDQLIRCCKQAVRCYQVDDVGWMPGSVAPRQARVRDPHVDQLIGGCKRAVASSRGKTNRRSASAC